MCAGLVDHSFNGSPHGSQAWSCCKTNPAAWRESPPQDAGFASCVSSAARRCPRRVRPCRLMKCRLLPTRSCLRACGRERQLRGGHRTLLLAQPLYSNTALLVAATTCAAVRRTIGQRGASSRDRRVNSPRRRTGIETCQFLPSTLPSRHEYHEHLSPGLTESLRR
jgi:hypothetical protein